MAILPAADRDYYGNWHNYQRRPDGDGQGNPKRHYALHASG
jgi:hypothetical protein